MKRVLAVIVGIAIVASTATYLLIREPLARASASVEAAKRIEVPAHVLAAFRTALADSGETRTFLAPTKTVYRRFNEKVVAIAVTTIHDEDELLRAYVSEIYLGQRGKTQIIGVRHAARVFFDKDIADVTLAEGALLAAIHRSPNARMLDRRVINGDEYRGAASSPTRI